MNNPEIFQPKTTEEIDQMIQMLDSLLTQIKK